MSLRDKLQTALKEAMKAKEAERLSALRLINAAIKDREIASRGEGGEGTVSDSDILAVLGRMVKQRQESVAVYEQGGRPELAQNERDEIAIIQSFMPKQLSDDEAKAVVADVIKAVGAGSVKDMGKVMAELKAKYAGQMDMAKAGAIVKALLG